MPPMAIKNKIKRYFSSISFKQMYNNMKKLLLLGAIVCTLGMMTACKSGEKDVAKLDFLHIKEFIPNDSMEYYADSIDGYATFSAENNIVIIPEEITKEQYHKLLTNKYTLRQIAIDTNTPRYAELYKLGLQNSLRYDSIRGLSEWEEVEEYTSNIPIYHYPETRQYEYVMLAPLTNESFMMTEDGVVDTTFMQSETRTYGTNRIFVGQEGGDCDFYGNLWFHWYDEQSHHMVPLCRYVDYRWSNDGVEQGFDICWISEDELLVAAVSNGNGGEWVGGYTTADLAPAGTPVYYKLKITTR